MQAIGTCHSVTFRSKPCRKPKQYTPDFHSPTYCRHNPDHPLTSITNKKPLLISTKFTNNRIKSSSPERENRKTKDWIHFVGIGGCGLSALAMLALKQGNEVSGSDIAWSGFMDGLDEAGARLYIGHWISNMRKDNNISCLPDAVVVSSAIPLDNVEISHAKALGVPVYKRDAWLRMITEHYDLIAVSGTHGKSTTASMLAYVLSAMGDDVTAVVGAHVPQVNTY